MLGMEYAGPTAPPCMVLSPSNEQAMKGDKIRTNKKPVTCFLLFRCDNPSVVDKGTRIDSDSFLTILSHRDHFTIRYSLSLSGGKRDAPAG